MLRPVPLHQSRVIDLSFGTDRMTLTAAARAVPVPGDDRTFDLIVDVRAWPFSGRVEDIALEDDLRGFAHDLAQTAVPGEIRFGGDRTTELVLSIERQRGGDAGHYVVEVSIAAAGDRFPRLTMLLFEQVPFWNDAATKIFDLVGSPDS
ncbi:MAG: hypothetical protein GY701_30250 [Sulfitobacter sp.]|nr:hypothetical protein [Sulfitobacter sp.]